MLSWGSTCPRALFRWRPLLLRCRVLGDYLCRRSIQCATRSYTPLAGCLPLRSSRRVTLESLRADASLRRLLFSPLAPLTSEQPFSCAFPEQRTEDSRQGTGGRFRLSSAFSLSSILCPLS